MTRRRSIPRGRNKKDLLRKSKNVPVKERVLIVCEGEKTEPNYFNRLISEYRVSSAQVSVHGEGGSAPISVFHLAQEILKKDDDFESIFLVFDRDRHETYDQTIALIDGLSKKKKFLSKNIKAITSVPCFEIWLMLHVSDSTKPYGKGTIKRSPAFQVLKDLSKYSEFVEYKKSDVNFFDCIFMMTDAAVGKASKIIRDAKESGEREHHEDSSSRIFMVVEKLKNIGSS